MGRNKDNGRQHLKSEYEAKTLFTFIRTQRPKNKRGALGGIGDQPVHNIAHENEESGHQIELEQTKKKLNRNDGHKPARQRVIHRRKALRNKSQKNQLKSNEKKEWLSASGNQSKARASHSPFSTTSAQMS